MIVWLLVLCGGCAVAFVVVVVVVAVFYLYHYILMHSGLNNWKSCDRRTPTALITDSGVIIIFIDLINQILD